VRCARIFASGDVGALARELKLGGGYDPDKQKKLDQGFWCDLS
jgi:hypothetical protein